MGWFDTIKSAIFGEAKAEEAAVSTASAAGATSSAASSATAAPSAASPSVSQNAPAAAAAASQPASVDVAAVLDKAVAAKGQKLDWRRSIVDLLKAIDVDSSLSARKELAAELGYTGSTSDSAAMNMWLHKQVIRKLAENGGQVPADLLD